MASRQLPQTFDLQDQPPLDSKCTKKRFENKVSDLQSGPTELWVGGGHWCGFFCQYRIEKRKRTLIAGKSVSAGLLITSLSVKRFTYKLRLFLAF